MNKFFIRVIGILEIGGGFLGAAHIIQMLFSHGVTSGKVIISLFVIALYLCGIICGILLIENHKQGVFLSRLFYAIQIPFFWFSVIGYQFISGFYAGLFLRIRPLRFGGNFELGSLININLLSHQDKRVIGINIFALVIFAYLTRLQASMFVAEDLALPNREERT